MKKLMRAILAAAMALTMTVTAFATKGYDLDKVDKVTGTGITEAINIAIDKAKKDNSDVIKVILNNITELTPEMSQKIVDAAVKVNKKAMVVVNTIKDKEVLVRVTVNPEIVARQKRTLNLTGEIGHAPTMRLFNKFFENNIVIVKLNQEYSYGQIAEVAAKADVSKLDPSKTWYFYSYNPKTNTYCRIKNPNYKMDNNGYIHFNTSRADRILITDEPLTRR